MCPAAVYNSNTVAVRGRLFADNVFPAVVSKARKGNAITLPRAGRRVKGAAFSLYRRRRSLSAVVRAATVAELDFRTVRNSPVTVSLPPPTPWSPDARSEVGILSKTSVSPTNNGKTIVFDESLVPIKQRVGKYIVVQKSTGAEWSAALEAFFFPNN